ncbi:MAG: TetR family transcriptional regulator C-terminal domain-containing protein, partial [Oscillospiraceae bacterium]|nr:TetR family transcriptional regulator C-terminal domain-containing protein [Oscillospiraceae bacterium]MBR2181113.1 TetR family transcriptional regulator C-terminal domain-containing protein [Oscillospiraceae bacterium]
LLQHLQKNDNNILDLLSSRNNELFLRYFKNNLVKLVESQLPLFESEKSRKLPESYRINHITSTFVETVRWWIDNGKKESPEVIAEYFFLAL